MRHYASSSAQENQARHKKPVSDGFYDCKALGASLSSDLQEADVTIALPIVVPFWGYLIGFCI